MSESTFILFLSIGIFVLIGANLYQLFAYRNGMSRKLEKITAKLREIQDRNSDEEIMEFTDNGDLVALMEQINRLLESNRKTKADFCRAENSTKKMLSNISHDIKTPMTVVLGYLEIMRLNQECREEMLEKTEQKAQSVMELINEFFTLAKIEAGDMDMELTRLNMNEVCRETVLSFYEILTRKAFQVELHIPETPAFVLGNRESIERILTNLITNVVRYGADGHYLGISVREEKKFFCLDVEDKGKGINSAFADHVFDRLFTLEDSRSRQIQGNGLGLTISKNLALQMGGDLTLDSIPYERTVFTVKLRKWTS